MGICYIYSSLKLKTSYNMKKQDFILWLRGYFAGVDKTKPIEDIINELFEKIEQLDINITEKVIERIIEKEYPIFPSPDNCRTIMTMYGCQTPNDFGKNKFNDVIY